MAIRKARLPTADTGAHQCCDKCTYYMIAPEGDDGGFCRRYPASINGWPNVWADDWCGEYKAAVSPEHLSIPEAGARYFGLSVNGSYLAARRGDLPWVQIGRYKRVPVSAMRHLVPKEP